MANVQVIDIIEYDLILSATPEEDCFRDPMADDMAKCQQENREGFAALVVESNVLAHFYGTPYVMGNPIAVEIIITAAASVIKKKVQESRAAKVRAA